MKIAMVSEHASPLATLGGEDAGGQNVHVAELARALGADGHEVTVYTRRYAGDLPETVRFAPGVSVRHVSAGPAREVAKDRLPPYMTEFGTRMAAEWAADPPDVVHAHFWMSGMATLKAVRGLGIPVVQTFHALGSVKQRHQGAKDTSPQERVATEHAVAHNAALVIATSNEERRELRSWGVPPDRITVVPCGVDLDLFAPQGPVAPRSRRPRVLSLGRLVERKGVETVIRSMAAVPGAELVVAGGPPRAQLHTDAEARRFAAIAAEAGVADRVEFIGRVAREDVPALLRSADVAVNVPWYEPFGMCTVEAMACGVPVIAAEVGGQVDTVVHESTGLLVPPRNPAVLAARLRTLLADPVRRENFGIAAANRAAVCFSWARVAQQTLGHYEGLLARPAAVRAPKEASDHAPTGVL